MAGLGQPSSEEGEREMESGHARRLGLCWEKEEEAGYAVAEGRRERVN